MYLTSINERLGHALDTFNSNEKTKNVDLGKRLCTFRYTKRYILYPWVKIIIYERGIHVKISESGFGYEFQMVKLFNSDTHDPYCITELVEYIRKYKRCALNEELGYYYTYIPFDNRRYTISNISSIIKYLVDGGMVDEQI